MKPKPTMSKRQATASHHERERSERRADRELAVEYLRAAMQPLDNPQDRAAGLLALRAVAEVHAASPPKPTSAANPPTAPYRPRGTQS